MEVLLLSLLFAFVLGFSAHRTGVCTVAAVAEVITSGSARLFWSFFKVVLWVLIVNALAGLFAPELVAPYAVPGLSLAVIGGGFLFGVGAAINGGCSFSTISKLAQGELHVALTLPAFVAGVISYAHLAPDAPAASAVTAGGGMRVLLFVLLLWAIYETINILGPMVRERRYLNAVRAKRYRLSTGAALMGICSGFLFLLHGRWAYSSQVLDYFGVQTKEGSAGPMAAFLFVALLIGAVVSAISSRGFRFSFAGSKWRKNLAGGFLMGFGAMMVPGGNAKLILQDIPHFSLHAVVAYASMVAGIALALFAHKRAFGRIDTVSCAGDQCQQCRMEHK